MGRKKVRKGRKKADKKSRDGVEFPAKLIHLE